MPDTDTVTVYIRATGTPTAPGDRDVPGVYRFDVDASLSEGDRASAVLDSFAAERAVGEPGDFALTVLNADGTEIETGGADTYTLDGRATFLGKVPETEVPAPATGPSHR